MQHHNESSSDSSSGEQQQTLSELLVAALTTRQRSHDGADLRDDGHQEQASHESASGLRSRDETWEQAPQMKKRTAKRKMRTVGCWPDEARDAAVKLFDETGSWVAVIAPFTKLAKEKGWDTKHTPSSICKAVGKSRGIPHGGLRWREEALRAVQRLYEETGSWDKVVVPFNALAAAEGWGHRYTKMSIYSAFKRWTASLRQSEEVKESNESQDRAVAVRSDRRKRVCVRWPREALVAAHKLFVELRCWHDVEERLKELAVEKGWSGERSEGSIRLAVHRFLQTHEGGGLSQERLAKDEDDDKTSSEGADSCVDAEEEADKMKITAYQQQHQRSESLRSSTTSEESANIRELLAVSIAQDPPELDHQPWHTVMNGDDDDSTDGGGNGHLPKETTPAPHSESSGSCGGTLEESDQRNFTDAGAVVLSTNVPTSSRTSPTSSSPLPSTGLRTHAGPAAADSTMSTQTQQLAPTASAIHLTERAIIQQVSEVSDTAVLVDAPVLPHLQMLESSQKENEYELVSPQVPRLASAADVLATAPAPDEQQPPDVSQRRLDNDLVLLFALTEYQKINQSVLKLEHAKLKAQTKLWTVLSAADGTATSTTTADADVTQQQLKGNVTRLSEKIGEERRSRDSAVARVLVSYNKFTIPNVFSECSSESSDDFPHVQDAIHVKCARLGAAISQQRMEISRLKRTVQKAINNRKQKAHKHGEAGGTPDVKQLGAKLASVEQAMEKHEAELLYEMTQLIEFSKQIRDDMQRMI